MCTANNNANNNALCTEMQNFDQEAADQSSEEEENREEILNNQSSTNIGNVLRLKKSGDSIISTIVMKEPWVPAPGRATNARTKSDVQLPINNILQSDFSSSGEEIKPAKASDSKQIQSTTFIRKPLKKQLIHPSSDKKLSGLKLQTKDSLIDVAACLNAKRQQVLKLWQDNVITNVDLINEIEKANELAIEASNDVTELRQTIHNLQKKSELTENDTDSLNELRNRILTKLELFEEKHAKIQQNLLQLSLTTETAENSSIIGSQINMNLAKTSQSCQTDNIAKHEVSTKNGRPGPELNKKNVESHESHENLMKIVESHEKKKTNFLQPTDNKNNSADIIYIKKPNPKFLQQVSEEESGFIFGQQTMSKVQSGNLSNVQKKQQKSSNNFRTKSFIPSKNSGGSSNKKLNSSVFTSTTATTTTSSSMTSTTEEEESPLLLLPNPHPQKQQKSSTHHEHQEQLSYYHKQLQKLHKKLLEQDLKYEELNREVEDQLGSNNHQKEPTEESTFRPQQQPTAYYEVDFLAEQKIAELAQAKFLLETEYLNKIQELNSTKNEVDKLTKDLQEMKLQLSSEQQKNLYLEKKLVKYDNMKDILKKIASQNEQQSSHHQHRHQCCKEKLDRSFKDRLRQLKHELKKQKKRIRLLQEARNNQSNQLTKKIDKLTNDLSESRYQNRILVKRLGLLQKAYSVPSVPTPAAPIHKIPLFGANIYYDQHKSSKIREKRKGK